MELKAGRELDALVAEERVKYICHREKVILPCPRCGKEITLAMDCPRHPWHTTLQETDDERNEVL